MKPGNGQAALGLLLALGAAHLAHRFVLDLELMGWDSYPIIAASRVEGCADLLDSFREELMDGRHPEGRFYRPVTNLAFAVDYASSGLRARGYQRTNLLLHLAGVVAVFGLGRRWLPGTWAPSVAALVFAIHPLQLETLPVAARRADLLFTLFLALALRVQPLTAPAQRGRLLASAGLALLSAASKETGAVAVPVLLGAVLILPTEGNARERTLRALRLCALPALALAGFLALRTFVLGGLGGHAGSAPLEGLALGLLQAPVFARSLLMPQPWSPSPVLDALLCAALAASLAACSVAAARRAEPGATAPSARRLAIFCAFWLLCLLAITGISGERASWYAMPFLPPYALLLGTLADAAARARARHRALALATGGLVLLLLGSHLLYSALLHRYEEWTSLSRQEADFLIRAHAAVAAAEPDTTVVVHALPLGTGAPLEHVGIRSALGMTDYSVEAWAELVFPDRPVRVRLHTGGPPTPPTPGVVTLDAVPLPSPLLRLAPGAPW